jgi:hypothetical protein
LSFVRELRSCNAVNFHAAGFQFLPLVLDELTPISEQHEPVVVRSILEGNANCCRHQEFQMGDEHEQRGPHRQLLQIGKGDDAGNSGVPQHQRARACFRLIDVAQNAGVRGNQNGLIKGAHGTLCGQPGINRRSKKLAERQQADIRSSDLTGK